MRASITEYIGLALESRKLSSNPATETQEGTPTCFSVFYYLLFFCHLCLPVYPPSAIPYNKKKEKIVQQN